MNTLIIVLLALIAAIGAWRLLLNAQSEAEEEVGHDQSARRNE